MTPPKVTNCSACAAAIVFERTVGGKSAPLNWPGEAREVFCAGRVPPADVKSEKRCLIGEAGVVVEDTWPPGSGGFPVLGFVSHFATCPERDRFRKSRTA